MMTETYEIKLQAAKAKLIAEQIQRVAEMHCTAPALEAFSYLAKEVNQVSEALHLIVNKAVEGNHHVM